MDFVVVGFGLGALIVLVGIAVRDLAPRLRRPDAPESDGDQAPGIYSIQRVPVERWAAACQKAGSTIMLGGGAIILAAVVGIGAGVDNGGGARMVLAVTLVVFGGIAARFGMLANELFPIDRRSRERARQLAQPAPRSVEVAAARPEAEPPAAEEVKPATPVEPVVATEEPAEAAEPAVAIGLNGASLEPIPTEVVVEAASTPGEGGEGGEDGEEPAVDAVEAEDKASDEAPVDAEAALVPAEAARDEPTTAAESSSDEDAQATAEEQKGVTDATESSPEVAASVRSNAEP
ncbi:MAG: hypothetical protein ACRDJW_05880 [Thermomicrobiales bacterium]